MWPRTNGQTVDQRSDHEPTDAGVTGLGEAYRGGGVTEVMEYMEECLVGENSLDVERLCRRMVQDMSGHGGTTGKVVTAASGIEITLWNDMLDRDDPLINEGYVEVPEEPGLGIALDADVVEEHLLDPGTMFG